MFSRDERVLLITEVFQLVREEEIIGLECLIFKLLSNALLDNKIKKRKCAKCKYHYEQNQIHHSFTCLTSTLLPTWWLLKWLIILSVTVTGHGTKEDKGHAQKTMCLNLLTGASWGGGGDEDGTASYTSECQSKNFLKFSN